MAKLIRYDVEHDYGSAWMEKHDSGDYVTFDDYQELVDNMTDLQIKYDNLLKALGKVQLDS